MKNKELLRIKCCDEQVRLCLRCKREFCKHYKCSYSFELCFDCCDEIINDWLKENKTNTEQICKNCGKILDKHDYEGYCVDDNGSLIVTQKFELKKNDN